MDLEEAYDKIYRYVYFKLKNQAISEDITQETFLRCIGRKGNIQIYDMKYLYTIARNLCVDEYRRVKSDPLPKDYDERFTASYESSEDRVIVQNALEKLTVEDKELLLLRYANNEPIGTISQILGISRFAVYRRLKTAEEKFRSSLEVDEG